MVSDHDGQKGTCVSVYFSVPSARPPAEAIPILREWVERGYHVVIQRDTPISDTDFDAFGDADCDVIERPYKGYAEAVNHLARLIITDDPEAEWIVIGGDDTLPDPNRSAEEIAEECSAHFGRDYSRAYDTFGVMQPTGDDWFDSQGRIIERVAGSPWLGRQFCRRMYGGRGPLWPGFFHMFEDEHLQCVAQKLGVFWQRPDLTHKHMHWCRPRPGEKMGIQTRMPDFLKRANSQEQWKASKAEFERLKAGGFAEASDLLP